MRYTWAHIRRRPLPGLAVLLFAAIITVVLSTAHRESLAAQRHYEEIYDEIDVRCTLTNLSGDKSDGLYIYDSLLNLFTGENGAPTQILDLVEDVQIKGRIDIYLDGESYLLVGVTTTRADPALWPENGCAIQWREDFDESFFQGSKLACLIPEETASKLKEKGVADTFPLHIPGDDWFADYDQALAIAGVTYGGSGKTIFVPWDTYTAICQATGLYESAESLSAKLRNNDDLQALREAASQYFAVPDPNAAGMNLVGDYSLALDINDSQLRQADLSLENSLRINKIASALIFLLSAAGGALVGFLMIRSRKREIALMRTLGTANGKIFLHFLTEQILCVLLGTALGGAAFWWRPLERLGIFVGIYFVGLSLALLVFLHSKLITSTKRGE